MPLCYELTQYPYIYIKTYWGAFNPQENNSINDNIINNRNKFIIDNNIHKIESKIPIYIKKEYENLGYLADHMETYKTKDNKYILIISPYCNSLDHVNITNKYEWVIIPSLYSTETTTYMKVITKKKASII